MKPDYLIHYGVKGMRWGVRKNKIKNSLATKIQKRRINKTYNKGGRGTSRASSTVKFNDKILRDKDTRNIYGTSQKISNKKSREKAMQYAKEFVADYKKSSSKGRGHF